MLKIKMYNVGNGLHMIIRNENFNDQLIVDYGGNKNLDRDFLFGDFILSHFHEDHYNGFTNKKFKKPHLDLTSLYYPAMPRFKENLKFYRYLFAINSLLNYRGNEPIQHSVLGIMKENNCKFLRPLECIPLVKGDKVIIGGHHIEVLWPPLEITDNAIQTKIKNAIIDFEKACEVDDRLKQIYKRIENLSEQEFPQEVSRANKNDFHNEDNQYEDLNKISIDEKSEAFRDEDRSNDFDIPEHIKDEGERGKNVNLIIKANTSLKSAANDLSLAFRIRNDLLFLGDLEEQQIGIVTEQLVKAKQMNYRVIATAHHGTHWHNALLNLSAKYCLASVGGLHYNLKYGYSKISKKFINTRDSGNILL